MNERRNGRVEQTQNKQPLVYKEASREQLLDNVVINMVNRIVQNISKWEWECFLLPCSSVPPSPETCSLNLIPLSHHSPLPQPEPPLMERGGESPENRENKSSNLWTRFSKSLISKPERFRHMLQIAFFCTQASAGHILLCLRVPGDLAQVQIDSAGLSWDLRFCISNKPPEDADAADPETTLLSSQAPEQSTGSQMCLPLWIT